MGLWPVGRFCISAFLPMVSRSAPVPLSAVPFGFFKKIWTEEERMEVTINYGGQLVSVEVSIEVYEFLDCADHKEENLAHEKRAAVKGEAYK